MRIDRVQDSVHGLMEFHGMETAVVNLASANEVQRLRRIKQLGVNNLVFPAAEHSRFSHSFGSAYLAVRFCKQVGEAAENILGTSNRIGPEDVRAIAIAALCHDLGHGPLSHMWEREVIGRFDRERWMQAMGVAGETGLDHLDWHELATQGLLAWPEGNIHKRLERYEVGLASRIRAILAGRYWLPYLPALLLADIDVDRCDFVARDAFHTGVGYGQFKLDWLISTITIGFHQGKPVIGFDKPKAFRAVEQFLIARRALYETVYQHKTVRSAEGMFGLLLKRLRVLVEGGSPPPFSNRAIARPLLNLFKNGVLEPADLMKLDDDALWLLVHDLAEQDRGDPVVRDLARRLLDRNLFKQVPIAAKEAKELWSDQSRRADLEEVLKTSLGCEDPAYYFHIDLREIQFMEQGDDSGGAYDGCARFINSGTSDRPAELVRSDKRLAPYAETEEEERLFVPTEALLPVKRFFGIA